MANENEKLIWIWESPDDGLLVLERGKRPRQPGRVFEVKKARGRSEAQAFVRLALEAEPDEEQDTERWTAWRRAQRRVRLVDLDAELEG